MAINKSPGRPFQPGQVTNPNGRPVGARNKRTQEIWEKLEKRGDLDPVEYLSSLVDNEQKPDEIRIAAAVALAPYKHSKRGLEPQPAPLVYVTAPVPLPYPRANTIEHTIRNIGHISALRRRGQLDQDTADRLVAEQRIIRDGLIEQAKLSVAQGGSLTHRTIIEGGLPMPPGCDIDTVVAPGGPPLPGKWPKVVNGEAVRPDLVAGPPVPFIPPEGSPLAEKPGPPEPPPPHLKPKPKPEDDPA
jgi:hypothetical protein